MNKLWKTLKLAPALIEMAFLCIRSHKSDRDHKTVVKRSCKSGTFLHRASGINHFSGGKTPFRVRSLCERIERRINNTCWSLTFREQRPTSSVFNV
jgi:hypothetical protein